MVLSPKQDAMLKSEAEILRKCDEILNHRVFVVSEADLFPRRDGHRQSEGELLFLELDEYGSWEA